jgi:type II secretory pathway predicted ATPase ExeA
LHLCVVVGETAIIGAVGTGKLLNRKRPLAQRLIVNVKIGDDNLIIETQGIDPG